ncbi:pyridoxal phosphate-dependent aminotransferase [Vibrio sp. ZSDE26]|uniref:cysteine-S-conjugate beta-lyase n=1 Tax=Vibrio amylolyticus TaxID=2847292 RepID=A0A9X1XLK5_9VIBR|nr:MalY/PatB family protein [Vibrio amylolyticus]MCK6265202.1 pyridoxal phosphate-dependent aminotransferase [Vibrio amylolyticus]
MFNFSEKIDRTNSYCTQWDYVEDRFGEPNLLPFTISDMDFSAPPVVIDALQSRIEHPVFGYSRWNHEDFKNAITGWFKTRFDTVLDSEHLVYGPSVIYIISQLIRYWSNTGQGVIIHTPAYDAFDKMILGLDRTIIANPLQPTSQGFQLDWHQFESHLADPNNKILLLCSPHNPTGKVWSMEELNRMAELCEKHNVAVISDEIHMDVCFKPHTPWYGFDMGPRWALVSSASKSFNIPALNGAYAFIAEGSARDQYLFNLKQVDGLSSPSILGVIGLMAAYQNGAPWLDALKEYLYANHFYVQQTLSEQLPSIKYQVPDATYLAWIDLSPLSIDMEALNQCLIKKHKVAIMQGSTYGEAGKNFVRLNLGCPRSKVEQGLAALILAIKELA